MKKGILFILTFFLMSSLRGQEFISMDILSKVFNLKYGDGTGTCFLIDSNQKNYFVTARHIFGDTTLRNKNVTVEVFQDSSWKRFTGKLLLHDNSKIDIALIEFANTDALVEGLSISSAGLTLGDHGFFLGFPYMLKSKDNGGINNGFPIPLIKSCFFSGAVNDNGIGIFWLDGMNNPGFSGGPVLFKNRTDFKDTNWHVAGVVSAYVNQSNQLITPIGVMNYSENSGIVVAISSKHIKEIINSR